MTRALRTAALAAVALLSLSGCMKMQMDFTLHEDDTVDGSIVMAIQKGIGETFDMSDEEILEQMQQEGSFEDIEGGTTAPYDDGDYIGQEITFDAQPLAELEQQEAGFTIEREGDEFVVGGEFDTGGQDMSMLGDAEVTLSVTFPGAVSEHNGTLEGTTVTWDLLTMTEPLNARGSASAGGGIPWLWIGIGGAALAVIAGVVIGVVVARKRATAPATVPGDDAAQGYAPEGAAVQGYAPQAYAPAPDLPPAYAPTGETPAAAPTGEVPVADAPTQPLAPEPVPAPDNPFAPPAAPTAPPTEPPTAPPAAPEQPEQPEQRPDQPGQSQQYPPPSYPPQ